MLKTSSSFVLIGLIEQIAPDRFGLVSEASLG